MSLCKVCGEALTPDDTTDIHDYCADFDNFEPDTLVFDGFEFDDITEAVP